MNNTWQGINYLVFAIIVTIFLIAIVSSVLIITKTDNPNKKYLYGFFSNLKQSQILALTLIIMNFLFLSFTMVMKIGLDLPIILISVFLILLSFIVLKDVKNIFINTIINLVNISLIYLANMVNLLRIGKDESIFYILQILMNIFGILFFLFTSVKFIKNIHRKEVKNGKN